MIQSWVSTIFENKCFICKKDCNIKNTYITFYYKSEDPDIKWQGIIYHSCERIHIKCLFSKIEKEIAKWQKQKNYRILD